MQRHWTRILSASLCCLLVRPDLALSQPAATPAQAETHGAAPANTVAGSVVTRPITADVRVTDAMLLNAAKDPNNWLLHGRSYDNQRYSTLKQINPANVKRLLPVSIIQTGIANSFEATPLVVNGIMYVSTPGDHVLAYDAATGSPLWSFTPALRYSNLCCGPQSRGIAVAYGKLFLAQLDGTITALDATNGELLWQSDYAATLPPDPVFYSFTMAPQVYDGMVVVGSSGAEYPGRGFVQAYDATNGKLIWRFRTTAAPSEPGGDSWSGDSHLRGGGSVWSTPAVDPQRGLIGFAVGNPNPDLDGHDRLGDNAYTNSIVGIDAKTGKLRWWHQEVPHDVWDYDAAAPVIFMDAKDKTGKLVPAAAQAGKVGNVFVVNRETGALLRKSDPFVPQSANLFQQPPTTGSVTIYPSPNGGSQWSPAAFSPRTRAFYVMGVHEPASFTTVEVTPYKPGTPVVGQVMGGKLSFIMDGKDELAMYGTLSAVNVDTGKIDWQYKSPLPMVGGVLATASDLVFSGEMDGHLSAFDARTGKKLWSFNLGVAVAAPPITYRVNGVQYVAVAAGGLSANGWPRLMAKLGRPSFGDVIAIFALADRISH
jgi:PQQ-dependent dehydrogenase (methanol/ethanol family)